jgi:hypothetical protein
MRAKGEARQFSSGKHLGHLEGSHEYASHPRLLRDSIGEHLWHIQGPNSAGISCHPQLSACPHGGKPYSVLIKYEGIWLEQAIQSAQWDKIPDYAGLNHARKMDDIQWLEFLKALQ